MRKAIALAACLAILTAAIFTRPISSAPPRPQQDEIARRKAAASEAKPSKQQMPASVQDFVELKAAARARKSVKERLDSAPQPEMQFESDILAQSSKSTRRKNVAPEDFGRSAELIQTFDTLREKAQSKGAVRVIVGLRADFEPEGEMPTGAAVLAQRRSISDSQEELLARIPSTGRGSITRFETVPFIALEVDADGVQALRASPLVTSLVEDVPIRPALAESVALVGAPTAWAAGFSGAGQTVAVLDTGVDKTHSFLASKVVSEACFSTTSSANNSSSVCPGGVSQSTSSGSGVNCSSSVEGCDHGTHVAGIVAGQSASFNGVARDANIIAVQIFSRFNSSSDCGGGPAPCVRTFPSDQMRGLERVFALRGNFNIASVNMSIGGGQNSSNCDSNPLKSVIDNLRSVGIATVIASGNDGFSGAISSPACISTAISVGSTNDGSGSGAADTVSSFSNSASFLSLLAPGSLIRSSVPGGAFSNFQGTSMATPHVAGAWAVLKSKSPTATVTQVLNALRDTGRQVTDVNGITKPRIRVDAAVNALGGGGGGGGCGSPQPIGIGQTINGSLASTDCRFPTGSERFSDAYTFSGTAGQQIAVSMSSTTFDTFVTLVGPNGAEVASNDDGGGGTNSRIPASSGFFTLSSTGTFTIQASSFSASTSGSYALSLTAQTTDGCATITPIAFGQTLNGTLSTSDCRFSDGSFFDKFSFSGTAGQQVSISMSSSFDTLLFLLKPDGSLLAEDDDGGGGTNSRIPASSGTITLPITGTYTILANSFDANVTGGYSLSLTGTAPGGSCPSTNITVGQTLNGNLSTSDCQLSDGSFFDSYTFSGTANQQISISMSSPTFDTYLLLLRPDGSLLAEDDDGGGGLNSRIPASSGTITLPVSGTYRILANSFSANATGSYTLSLAGNAPISCPASSIAFGQVLNRSLSNTDCQFTDGSFFDAYNFNGTAGQQVAVSMSSLAFDTYLFLIGPNGLVVDDDDGGGNLNSRIPAGTGFFTLPTTGAYSILANSFAPGVTGNYSLSLIASQTGCSYSNSSASASFSPSGGTGSVGVTAGGGCGWTAVSNASWLGVTAGASGSGSGTVNFSVAPNTTSESRTGTMTIAGGTFSVEQAANTNSTVQFATSGISVNEADKKVQLTISRTGNTASPATVGFATSDNNADRRSDYTQTLGTLSFSAGQTSKIVTVFITDDTLVESPETFNVTLSNPSGTTLGSQSTFTVTITSNDTANGPNPVDPATFNSPFYVSQHYFDFLNREPDTPGLNFWTNEIESCGSNQQCREAKRINVSAAFFLSIEFQETGYLVYRMYKSAFGDTTSPNVPGTVPIIRLSEFLADTQRIGQGVVITPPPDNAWQAVLESNKQTFALEFVSRQRFLTAFPLSLTPTQFVDQLNQRAGLVLSATERTQLISELTADNTSVGRASVLRKVAEDADLRRNENNRAFVLMQFYGYLRRNPDDPQDTDFRGWKFWLDKLNQFNGNFVQAEMVKAFIESIEYKKRFGP